MVLQVPQVVPANPVDQVKLVNPALMVPLADKVFLDLTV
jgi:hypothetical protein